MNETVVTDNRCKHTYILYLGKNPQGSEQYQYCLTCGQRIRGVNYGCLVTDATRFQDVMPVDTEEDRQRKVALLQSEYLSIAEQESWKCKEEVISKFKNVVEQREAAPQKRIK